jgi:hypothetical protein
MLLVQVEEASGLRIQARDEAQVPTQQFNTIVRGKIA